MSSHAEQMQRMHQISMLEKQIELEQQQQQQQHEQQHQTIAQKQQLLLLQQQSIITQHGQASALVASLGESDDLLNFYGQSSKLKQQLHQQQQHEQHGQQSQQTNGASSVFGFSAPFIVEREPVVGQSFQQQQQQLQPYNNGMRETPASVSPASLASSVMAEDWVTKNMQSQVNFDAFIFC